MSSLYKNKIQNILQYLKKRKSQNETINSLFTQSSNSNNTSENLDNTSELIDVEMFSSDNESNNSDKYSTIDIEMNSDLESDKESIKESAIIDVEMSDQELYNNTQNIDLTNTENDMIINYLIDNHKENVSMEFDWSLPKLNNKQINIGSYTYTIKLYKDNIENYVKNMANYDSKTIFIPELSNKISKDTYLAESLFVSFLNKSILEFNSAAKTFNSISEFNSYSIEPFNPSEDVIYVDKNGNIYGGSLINTLSKRNSSLLFIPVKIKYESNFHLNILVIDNINKTFTYYEPYGDYFEYNNLSIVNTSLQKIKTYILNTYKDYKYIDAHILNKNKTLGVQLRSEKFYHISEGYCVAWCLYLCYITIFNFHLKSEYSITTILNKIFEEYTDLNLIALIRIFIKFVKLQVKQSN